MNSTRNRSKGWTHAKLSGHENEEKVNLLFNQPEFCRSFEQKFGIKKIIGHSIGGLCEASVEGILGKKTKSKTDLILHIEDGSSINISIKKSNGGQVYLISLKNLLEGLNILFGVDVSSEEREALELYFSNNNDERINSIIETIQNIALPQDLEYMRRKHRLTAKYIEAYNPAYPSILLNWFKRNISSITRFCFSTGLVKDSRYWAEYVWYINKVNGEEWGSLDTIFKIDDICIKCNSESQIDYGNKLGGSTIQLPFGFVQWHQSKPQFHHKFQKIKEL